ncbi:MAG: c-type cytochrome [Burkholderiales bacterium]
MTKAALVLLLWPLILLAQEVVPANAGSGSQTWNVLTGEELAALKRKGDAGRGEEAFTICRGCHRRGATGSVSGMYPRLAGQHVTVLIKQMTDIRSGKRQNPKMEPFIDSHAVTTQEIADIAVYLQALPIPPNLGVGPGTALARGNELYLRDCATCHGDKGQGNAEKFFPLVAGQHFKYLLREEQAIRNENRGNANPDMVKVIKSYSDKDLEAVADYISRLSAH